MTKEVQVSAAQERAKSLSKDPKVKAWCKRLQKLIDDQPPEVWVFSGAGVTVMALTPEKERYMTEGGGVDGESSVYSVSGRINWEGGDF